MVDSDRQRFFIVTPGRTGSSLLAAVLARSGADFGVTPKAWWDPGLGDLEHPDFARAGHLYEKAHRLAPDTGKPPRPLDQLYWTTTRHFARTKLKSALLSARYLKAGNGDLALQPAFRLGYKPVVILNYRRFEPQLASLYIRSTYWTVDVLAEKYKRTMRNGLAAVHLFGGCVVSFDDLQSAGQEEWASVLGKITGLAAADILTARRSLARPMQTDPELPCLDVEAERLFNEADALRGQQCKPLRPAMRVLESIKSPLAAGAPAMIAELGRKVRAGRLR